MKYKAVRMNILGFNLQQSGWIRMPFGVDPEAIAVEFKNATKPTWPPTSLEGAEQLMEDFALWCSQVKGYDIYANVTLEVG